VALNFRRRGARVGEDAEFSEAAVLGRRVLLATGALPERRTEPRRQVELTGTASVLGCEETRTRCRIINVSRSGMRIALDGALPPDAQINVEWGSEFFVGTIRCQQVRGDRHILGLSVVSTNRR
jgi:hypothetical protein